MENFILFRVFRPRLVTTDSLKYWDSRNKWERSGEVSVKRLTMGEHAAMGRPPAIRACPPAMEDAVHQPEIGRCSSPFVCTFDLLWRLSCCCARVNVSFRKRALGVRSASGGHYSLEQIIYGRDVRMWRIWPGCYEEKSVNYIFHWAAMKEGNWRHTWSTASAAASLLSVYLDLTVTQTSHVTLAVSSSFKLSLTRADRGLQVFVAPEVQVQVGLVCTGRFPTFTHWQHSGNHLVATAFFLSFPCSFSLQWLPGTCFIYVELQMECYVKPMESRHRVQLYSEGCRSSFNQSFLAIIQHRIVHDPTQLVLE